MTIIRNPDRPFTFTSDLAVKFGLYEAIILENLDRFQEKPEDEWNDVFPFFPRGLIHRLIKELEKKGIIQIDKRQEKIE